MNKLAAAVGVHCLVAAGCILIFKLCVQSRAKKIYRENFYLDIGLCLAQLHQLLSGIPPGSSIFPK